MMPDRELQIMLARLDERVMTLERETKALKAELSKLDDDLNSDLREHRQDMENLFVKKDLFQPVQKAVFTLAGFIVLAVLTAILGLVLPKQ
jgi:hypothetical protein